MTDAREHTGGSGSDGHGRRDRPSAIIIGGGVAGLTAAHELALRNFEVHVVEREIDSRGAGQQPALGGLARSQVVWAELGESRPGRPVALWETGVDGVSFREPRLVVPLVRFLRTPRDGKVGEPAPPKADDEIRVLSTKEEVAAAVSLAAWSTMASFADAEQEVPILVRMRVLPDQIDDLPGWVEKNDFRKRLKEAAKSVWPKPTEWSALGPDTCGIVGDVSEGLVGAVDALNRGKELLKAVLKWIDSARIVFVDHRADLTYPHETQKFPDDTPMQANGDIVLLLPEAPARRGGARVGGDVAGGRGERSTLLECAGEHGFRFFPSFYAHVFDTMQRIPVLDEGEDWLPDTHPRRRRGLTGDRVYRTVFDNLISQDQFALGLPDGEGFSIINRGASASLSEAFRSFDVFQRRLGFEARDIVRLELKILEYLTSCPERRDGLGKISWSEYLGVKNGYSDGFQKAMEGWPQVLVGMRGGECDARTYAGIVAQMITDPLRKTPMRDATLNGSTSTAWLDPWKRYLRQVLNVRFHRDEAISLYATYAYAPSANGEPSVGGAADGATPRKRPVMQVRAHFAHGLRYRADGANLSGYGWRGVGDAAASSADDADTQSSPEALFTPADVPEKGRAGVPSSQAKYSKWDCVLPPNAYLVLAVNPHEAHRLTKTLQINCGSPTDPVAKSVANEVNRSKWLTDTWNVLGENFSPNSLRDGKFGDSEKPRGALRHFVGLQFFFAERDVSYLKGHLFFPEHPYAISGISQGQFRVARASTRSSAGTLSFDLGDVNAEVVERDEDSTLWNSSRATVQQNVWQHLQECMGPDAAQQPPAATGTILYHIDENVIYDEPTQKPAWWEHQQPPIDQTARNAFYFTPWRLAPDWRPNPDSREPVGVTAFENKPVRFNNTPYLIVPPGAMARWPGTLDPKSPRRGYDVELGNLVCCGSHVKTFTRMATMESANESARHAVNGILRDYYQRPPGVLGREVPTNRFVAPTRAEPLARVDAGFCDIFPLDDREPEELRFARELDARLMKEGLPHLFEIMGLDAKVADGMPGKNDPREGAGVVDEMLGLLSGATMDPVKFTRWASPFLLQMLSTFLKMSSGR